MVFITGVENLMAIIHLPRRNILNVEKLVTSPQITKNEENSSTSKKFEGKKNIFKKYNKKKNGKACYVE
jgi:hypothetical protein